MGETALNSSGYASPPYPPDCSDAPYDEEPEDVFRQLSGLLLRGVFYSAACLNCDQDTLNSVDLFDAEGIEGDRVRQLEKAMTANVRCALYLAALKGKVAAQLTWLRVYGGPEWEKMPAAVDPFAEMTDDELRSAARDMDVPLPPELDGQGNEAPF